MKSQTSHSRPVRRIARWVLNLLAFASALLLLAVCVLWYRGYRCSDVFYKGFNQRLGEATELRIWRAQTLQRGFIFEYFRLRTIGGPVLEMNAPHWTHERDAVADQGEWVEDMMQALGFGQFPSFKAGSLVVKNAHGALGVAPSSWKENYRDVGLATPAWLLALVCALLPAWRTTAGVRAFRRKRRRRVGYCAGCGYDLRASTDRCPECGRAIELPAT